MKQKTKCPICNKFDESTKPRFVGKEQISDPRFKNSILTLKTLVCCDKCAKNFGITTI